MSIKALDAEKLEVVYAKDAIPQKNYRCCAIDCPAIMRLRRGKTPCFFALESHPHSRNCDFSNYSEAANYELTDDFSIAAFIESLELLRDSGRTSSQDAHIGKNQAGNSALVPRTPKQLYDYCQIHQEIHSEICIDSFMDSGKMAYCGYHGMVGGKVICGYIDKYLKDRCLVISVKHRVVPNRFLNIVIKMDSETYQHIVQKLLNRAGKVLEAKVIVCANCIKETTVSSYFKTQTTAILKTSSQVFVYLGE